MSARNLDLVLSSAADEVTALSPSPSIAKDGSQAYAYLYNIPGLPLVKLYDNVDGTLVTRHTLLNEAAFRNLWTGYASPDFDRFSVIDGTIEDAPNNLRFRLLDRDFNVVAERFFSIGTVALPTTTGTLAGGFFSEDGEFVSLQYTVDVSPTESNTLFFVLRTSDLSTFVQAELPGFDFGTSRMFTLTGRKKRGCRQKQLYLQYQQFAGTDANPMPPYFSTVYKIKSTGITFVAKQPLPNFSDTPSVLSFGRYAVISHGGFCSLFPNQTPRIYDCLDGITTTLPDDNAESRILYFDGERLELVHKQAVNCCNRTTIFPPHRGYTYLVGQNTDIARCTGTCTKNVPGMVCDPCNHLIDREFFCLASLVDRRRTGRELKGENLPQQTGNGPIPIFSLDGRWLFYTATYGYNVPPDFNPTPDKYALRNLLLFRVVDKGRVCPPLHVHPLPPFKAKPRERSKAHRHRCKKSD